MKRLILGLITVLILSVPAYAKITFTLKDGSKVTWASYIETPTRYCSDSSTIYCIDKADMDSIREVVTGEEVKINLSRPRSKEEIDREKEEAAKRAELIKKWQEEKKIEEVKKKEAEYKERLIKIEEEKAEAAKRTAEAAEEYNRLMKIQHYDNMIKR